MTNAYASIGNNGVMKQPKLIDSVYNRHGELLYSPKDLYHKDDTTTSIHTNTNEQKPDPEIGFLGKKVTDDSTNYQILSLIEGVIQRGSAQRAKVLQRTVAGKTGTTNDSFDTWFIGMTPDITVGVFVGYDIPKSMGKHSTGSNVALPIFIDFFKNSKFIPDREFEVPNSISKNYVDQETGNITEEKDFIEGKKYILENFKDTTSESIYTDSQLNTKLNENIESLPQSLDIDTNSVFSILENEEQEIVNDSEDTEDTDEEQNER